MIFGVGTDIVQIARIESSLAEYGERFAQRILADSEFETFKLHNLQANFLAKRYAAKEATAKAFGTGFSNGLSLRDITVQNDQHGRPSLSFFSEAERFIKRNGIVHSHISLSDEKEYAIAFVILEFT